MKGNTRRSVVVLAVVAMVAGLLALPALPASAAAATASYTADFSACPAGVIPSAGFTDTTSSFAMANIDCVAYYGITKGTSATTYDPASPVTRWQMALFLTRAAGPAGITLGAGADQGFTDISGLPAEYQTAINQLAELGITKGTSATTFSPDGVVTREQMALFIRRFLADAVRGPGEGLTALIAGADGATDFTDVAGTSFEAHNAITDLFELGVTTGTTATTFSPGLSVSREQMAAFIGRALAHTNARPAGVNLQIVPSSVYGGDTVDLAVSVRSATFAPMANAYVDVFEAATADASKAFKTDGTCDTAYVSNTYGITPCAIDVADPDTDSNGNFADSFTVAASTTYWAWSGAQAATFDADTTQYSMGAVATSAAPTDLELTDNVPSHSTDGVKYGTTVTLTVQVVDTDGNAVAEAGDEIWIQSQYISDAVNQGITTYKLTTDASGKATLSFTHSDPSTSAGDVDTETWSVAYSEPGLGLTSDTWGSPYVWMDAASVATETVASAYGADYSTGDSLVAQATVYDQYGVGMSGVSVDFSDTGTFVGATRNTNSSGVAVQPITDTNNEIDTVTADAGVGLLTDTVMLYFGVDGTTGAAIGSTDGTTQLTILSVDTTHSKIVADVGGVPNVYAYDSGDFFYTGATLDPTSFADFVDYLDTDTTYSQVYGYYNTSGISSFYVH